ncbi:MAG: dihydroorotase [Sphingobacteriales bacterium]|nr:dihydroorotase [Sphingobacteriales bacterium]
MKYLIKNGTIVNEGKIEQKDILIDGNFISRIDRDISDVNATVVDASDKHVIPGIIDDQVHFREPGLTHKATIYTEAKAAVAGGVTSFMEMPNTKPAALTQDLLEDKYRIAATTSLANYSFYMGTSNENLEEVLKTNPSAVCGIKIFMGASTGNMLVDNEKVLRNVFSRSPMLIATHCEDEKTIRENVTLYKERYGEYVPLSCHPEIRSAESCYLSSSFAVDLAKEYNTRLHILHISTEKEVGLFDSSKPLKDKRITSEVCVHHLYFQQEDYAHLGALIKCNPAIKYKTDKDALLKGLLDDRLDVIATDHAPHTLDEKQQSYFQAPAGLPLVQHAINIMLDFYHHKKITLERIVEKMSHAPAVCFNVQQRGFLREGYFADIAVVDLHEVWKVEESNILYKCSWSPLEEREFRGKVKQTFVSGHLAYNNGHFDESQKGQRLLFERNQTPYLDRA